MSEALRTTIPHEYPTGRSLHEDPSVWLCENFATAEEMAELLDAAYEKLQPAQVAGDNKGYLSAGRSGSNCWMILPSARSMMLSRVCLLPGSCQGLSNLSKALSAQYSRMCV